MDLPKRSCMRIVTEISNVIGEQVNMMDRHGCIVASTDPARIGMFHGGAKRIVDERLALLIVRAQDEYPGAYPGVNLPLEYQGDIVGVIGVTGPAEQVEKYGRIIKKMTEILMLDIAMQQEDALFDRIRTRFLTDWIHTAPQDVTPQLVENGRQTGVDITLPRRILLVCVVPLRAKNDAALQRRIDEAEKRLIHFLQREPGTVTFKAGSEIVVAVQSMDDRAVLALAESIRSYVRRDGGLDACVGVDRAEADYTQINLAYGRAKKALRSCMRLPDKGIRLYDGINMEIFSGDVPDLTKLEYIRSVFRNCTAAEIAADITMLNTLYACEGSITRAAGELFIHKNTLQYRLRQLAAKTGYDPRSLRFAALYEIAIHFYADVRERL